MCLSPVCCPHVTLPASLRMTLTPPPPPSPLSPLPTPRVPSALDPECSPSIVDMSFQAS